MVLYCQALVFSTVLHDYAIKSGILWELSCIQGFVCLTRSRVVFELQYCMTELQNWNATHAGVLMSHTYGP